MRQSARSRIEVNLDELDRIIDHGTKAPLSEADGQKIKAALHVMGGEADRQEEYGEDCSRSAGANGFRACQGTSDGCACAVRSWTKRRRCIHWC